MELPPPTPTTSRPRPPPRAPDRVEYPIVKLRILSETTEEIAKDKGVNVRVKTPDPCELTLELRVEQGNSWYQLGVKEVKFGESGGKKDILIKFSDSGDLNRKKKSRVFVEAISNEGIYDPIVATKEKELAG